ncbi:MAG: putative bifunctional diguanylate cyclase/phosphodiesterase, partial [Spongiibacteraceae bacterium]
IISTILTLFLVTSLISIILRPSLRRLVSLAQILPMLSLSQFDEAREQLTVIDKASKEPDEIDLLTSTTGELINALESMNENIEQHRHKLKQKITALTEANNFTDMLLDSSPLAIVVHDREGSIKNINRLGRQLTGLDLDILPQANINRWVKNPSQGSTISNTTRALLNEVGQKSQEEMSLFTADGEQLDYFWLHTSISVHDTICILSIGIDMTERRKAAESLRWLGRHDRVSGLLNRTTFSEEADHWISQHGGIENVNFLMLDVDHLAVFNDRFGFKAGDELLASIANRLTETLPEDSLIGRTGAGEFSALLLHNQDHSEEAEKSQLESLTRYFHEMEGGSEEVSLSAVVNPYRGEYNGIDELISDTSAAMNRLKAKSRGHLVYAIDEKEARISRQERYVMRSQLQGALDNNRFLLFYQPILDVANNEISHCECLIRLLDDDGEIQPPAQFLRIAAESGMMTAIDYAVIEMAMKQQRKWDDAGITTGLSINLTAPTLEQPDFHDRLQALLEKTGANPQKLIFEVVETDGIEDLYTANVLLKKFRAIGAKIAFDDFGVGFTSFEYVRELPVDYIKIDQSFIRFLSDRANDQALVKSMVEMSHSLGKHVIAEGVEDLRALEMLKAMGVEYIQGYYISKPMPINLLDLSLSLPGGGDSFKNTA